MTDETFKRIAFQEGTPTYVYDLDHIDQQVKKLKNALDARIYYAVKANPCGAILKHLAAQNIGAEVISLGELERAVRAGIAPQRIVLGGPRQDLPLIERALALGVRLVSLDSLSQWQLWQDYAEGVDFLVRVNPALDPQTHEHLATGAAESKFGMTVTEAHELAADLGSRLAGFHVHAGSQISVTEVFDEIFSVLAPLYEAHPDAKVLDIGGGYGVPEFDLTGYAERVRAFAERFNLEVMIEPGRYLVANAGTLLTRVLHSKVGALHHVITDAGMSDLLRPALYSAEHPIKVVGKTVLADYPVDIDGPLCENADRLARARTLPKLEAGDLLAVGQAGAYGMAMSSNYASSFRPAEVTVFADSVKLVRRRETVEDLLNLEQHV